MKRFVLTLLGAAGTLFGVSAQKYALVDMEYVMSAIPAYETANEQLDHLSIKGQREVEVLLTEVQTMYKKYQTELVFVSEGLKTKGEEEMIAQDKAEKEVKRK